MIAQVLSFKQKYPDAIILMRGGDFYNMYGEDAEKCARTLGLALSECKYEGKLQQTASFPHHSLDVYLPKLVRAGYRIAICDQLEEVKKTPGKTPTTAEPKEEPAKEIAEEPTKEVAMKPQSNGFELAQVLMTRDDKGANVLYVRPKEGRSITVYPEASDIKSYYKAFRQPEFDSVRESLGQKYYAMVQRQPELNTNLLEPDTGDADLSRISKVNITKDRYKENTTIMFATIDGVQQKPVELTNLQAQRFWLSDDKNQYKVALAAQLFSEKLGVDRGRSEGAGGMKPDEPEEERRGIHL